MAEVFRNSGKDYNDFGRYKQCKNKEGFVYYLLTCKDDGKCSEKFLTTMSIGLCVPEQCAVEDIESILPEFLYMINSIAIPYEFTHIGKKNDSNPHFWYFSDLKIVNSEEKNKEVTTIRFGNILMIILLIAIGASVIGSTVYGWTEEKKLLKEKQLEKAKIAEENMKRKDPKFRGEQDLDESYSTVQDKTEPSSIKQKVIDSFKIQTSMERMMRKGNYVDTDPELEILNFVKVWSMILIVLGNTHYYLMSGPLQNMQIIDHWPRYTMFMFVLQSDLQSDVFYWITAFTWSFTILKSINQLNQ